MLFQVPPHAAHPVASGAGKTTWAQQHSTSEPGKRYVILGSHAILAQMRVVGPARAAQPPERLQALTAMAQECYEVLLERAPRLARNYILDQTKCVPNVKPAQWPRHYGLKSHHAGPLPLRSLNLQPAF